MKKIILSLLALIFYSGCAKMTAQSTAPISYEAKVANDYIEESARTDWCSTNLTTNSFTTVCHGTQFVGDVGWSAIFLKASDGSVRSLIFQSKTSDAVVQGCTDAYHLKYVSGNNREFDVLACYRDQTMLYVESSNVQGSEFHALNLD